MLSRRALIGKMAAGAAVSVAWVAGEASMGAASSGTGSDGRVTSGPATAPAPWELLQPLTAGAEVAHGWRVSELSAIIDGACVLTLVNDAGRTHRIHLCRNDGQPQGLVHTQRMDLVVMNGGQGSLPTDEDLAQAVAVVAHALAANEGTLQVASLLPHAERLRAFGDGVEAKLR